MDKHKVLSKDNNSSIRVAAKFAANLYAVISKENITLTNEAVDRWWHSNVNRYKQLIHCGENITKYECGNGYYTKSLEKVLSVNSIKPPLLPPKVQSPHEILKDLLALAEEFPLIHIGSNHMTVHTEAITLSDNFYFGVAKINWQIEGNTLGMSISGMENSYHNEHIHPHVGTTRKLCLGDGNESWNDRVNEGCIYDATILTASILNTYSRETAYYELENRQYCDSCNGYVEDLSVCAICDDEMCDSCLTKCGRCRCYICNNCMIECQCGVYRCINCCKKCYECGELMCDGCIQTCHKCDVLMCDNHYYSCDECDNKFCSAHIDDNNSLCTDCYSEQEQQKQREEEQLEEEEEEEEEEKTIVSSLSPNSL